MRQDVIDSLFEKSRFYPHIMLETAMNNALATLVSRGFCCTILPIPGSWPAVTGTSVPGSACWKIPPGPFP